MNFENKENSLQVPPEKNNYRLDRDNQYKVFEKTCKNCEHIFFIRVPNRGPNSNFIAGDGRKIKVKELEEKAEAQKFCPECENKVVKIVDQKNK